MRCWSCEKAEMVDTSDGFHPFKKCPECGATWCDIPTPGGFTLATEPVSGRDSSRKYKAHPVSKRKAKA